MYHERSRVQQSDGPSIDNVSTMVHLYQITPLYQRKGDTEWIDPKRSRVYWVYADFGVSVGP